MSGLSGVVGTFFVKDYLSLSAAFPGGAQLLGRFPGRSKMPVGHLVDLIWRWKNPLVYLGAGLIAVSIAIMYADRAHRPDARHHAGRGLVRAERAALADRLDQDASPTR